MEFTLYMQWYSVTEAKEIIMPKLANGRQRTKWKIKHYVKASSNPRMRFLHFLWREYTAYSKNNWFIKLRLSPDEKKKR